MIVGVDQILDSSVTASESLEPLSELRLEHDDYDDHSKLKHGFEYIIYHRELEDIRQGKRGKQYNNTFYKLTGPALPEQLKKVV